MDERSDCHSSEQIAMDQHRTVSDVEYHHPENGRRCKPNRHGVWTIATPGEDDNPHARGYTCIGVHPGQGVYLPKDAKWEGEVSDTIHEDAIQFHGGDRGDFGMPGVGVGKMWDIPVQTTGKVERVCEIMDEAQRLYKRKAERYKHSGGDTANVLGAKGQFADMNRKFWVLKGMLWDETISKYPDEGCGESAEEVLMDFIGHAALTIDFLRESQGGKVEGPQS